MDDVDIDNSSDQPSQAECWIEDNVVGKHSLEEYEDVILNLRRLGPEELRNEVLEILSARIFGEFKWKHIRRYLYNGLLSLLDEDLSNLLWKEFGTTNTNEEL